MLISSHSLRIKAANVVCFKFEFRFLDANQMEKCCWFSFFLMFIPKNTFLQHLCCCTMTGDLNVDASSSSSAVSAASDSGSCVACVNTKKKVILKVNISHL